MKKLPVFAIFIAAAATNACAAYSDRQFRSEIKNGLDIISARETVDIVADPAPGALGAEVYEYQNVVQNDDIKLFVPTSMYLRAGGGYVLPFATSRAEFAGHEYDVRNAYSVQIGLGWNLSSYVRTELDFQTLNMEFSDLDDLAASYQTVGAMLNFDLLRRYVQNGDVTRRRVVVPFIGVGAGVGHYAFDGADGADGVVFAAPRAEIGLNVMLTDLIGIDIAYQYQMMIGRGFGWDVRPGGVDSISNIMATFRVNF